jgi:hypothetical protein
MSSAANQRLNHCEIASLMMLQPLLVRLQRKEIGLAALEKLVSAHGPRAWRRSPKREAMGDDRPGWGSSRAGAVQYSEMGKTLEDGSRRRGIVSAASSSRSKGMEQRLRAHRRRRQKQLRQSDGALTTPAIVLLYASSPEQQQQQHDGHGHDQASRRCVVIVPARRDFTVLLLLPPSPRPAGLASCTNAPSAAAHEHVKRKAAAAEILAFRLNLADTTTFHPIARRFLPYTLPLRLSPTQSLSGWPFLDRRRCLSSKRASAACPGPRDDTPPPLPPASLRLDCATCAPEHALSAVVLNELVDLHTVPGSEEDTKGVHQPHERSRPTWLPSPPLNPSEPSPRPAALTETCAPVGTLRCLWTMK